MGVLAPLLKRGTAIILENWSPRAALDLITSEKATGVVANSNLLKSSNNPLTDQCFDLRRAMTQLI